MFVQAQRQSRREVASGVPVISSLVTTDIEQDANSWFFRTNVDVSRRVMAIHGTLSKRLLSSVAVLYEDTEFGRRAERAFREECVRKWPEANYRAYPFGDFDEAHVATSEILEHRPEAVGIFAERPFIQQIHQEIPAGNDDGMPYEPFVFTVIDLRLLAKEVDDIHFVSVVVPPKGSENKWIPIPADGKFIGNIKGLSYDTTCMVLDAIQQIPERPLDGDLLRRSFATRLAEGVRSAGEKTSMNFKDFDNTTRPQVFHLKDGKAQMLPHTEELGWFGQRLFKYRMVLRRFGFWPVGIAIGLFLLSMLMTFWDVHNWYGGRKRTVLKSPHFWPFAVLNALLVVAIYDYLCSSGQIAWDNPVTGLLIALAPSAVFKSTVIETQRGVFGLRPLYNKLLTWFSDKMMVNVELRREKYIKILAYFNSLVFLKGILTGLYESAYTAERREALLKGLGKDLDDAPSTDRKLRLCAIRLLRNYEWSDLLSLAKYYDTFGFLGASIYVWATQKV